MSEPMSDRAYLDRQRQRGHPVSLSLKEAEAVFAVLDAAAWVVAAESEDEGGEWDLSHEELTQAVERLETVEGWSRNDPSRDTRGHHAPIPSCAGCPRKVAPHDPERLAGLSA